MRKLAADDSVMIRYLLGQLLDAERDHFEDRYFGDNDLHEQLQAIEEELIDAYVDGDLTGNDRICFENRFMDSPERLRNIQFARALRVVMSARPESLWRAHLPDETARMRDVDGATAAGTGGVVPSPHAGTRTARKFVLSILIDRSFPMPVVFAATAALLVCWLAVSYVRQEASQHGPASVAKLGQPETRTPSAIRPPNAPETRTPQALAKSPGALPRQAPTPNANRAVERSQNVPKILALALVPTTRGEGNGNTIALPPGTVTVRLKLGLETDVYHRYAAVVEAADGKEVWNGTNLTVTPSEGSAKHILVNIPSDLLDPGDYVVKLTGLNPNGKTDIIAGYSFRVARR